MGNNLSILRKKRKINKVSTIDQLNNYLQSCYTDNEIEDIKNHRLWYIVIWYFTYYYSTAVLLIWLLHEYHNIKIEHINHQGIEIICNYGTFNWMHVPITFYC